MEPALSDGHDFEHADGDDREAEEVTGYFAILTGAEQPAAAAPPAQAPGELDEACSLIAWGLAPEKPRAECRARLLARLAGDEPESAGEALPATPLAAR